jgi:putative DNA primase/helicase
LRVDGTLLSHQGYDKATGLYLTEELAGLSVPDKPSRRQADTAIGVLTDLLASFPFVQEPAGLALSVALAGLLGAVLRPTLPACPLIGVTAPAAGTGKSYLVDLISVIATGRRAVGIATGARPEEFEKSLGAALLEGRPVLCLDNMVLPLGGQLLCMALSQERVAVRILGHSRSADVPAAAAMFATGNGLRIMGDIARRTLLCRLDAAVEHPESRAFDGDLLAEARRRRAELVGAALTIARWHQARRDPVPRTGRLFAGFDAWCARVRDPLLVLGHTDPVGALDVTRDADLEVARLGMLIEQWSQKFGETPTTCGDAIRGADADLIDALVAVTGNRPDAINSRRLSNYLARFEGRIVDGRRFQQDGKQTKAVCWKLETLKS